MWTYGHELIPNYAVPPSTRPWVAPPPVNTLGCPLENGSEWSSLSLTFPAVSAPCLDSAVHCATPRNLELTNVGHFSLSCSILCLCFIPFLFSIFIFFYYFSPLSCFLPILTISLSPLFVSQEIHQFNIMEYLQSENSGAVYIIFACTYMTKQPCKITMSKSFLEDIVK